MQGQVQGQVQVQSNVQAARPAVTSTAARMRSHCGSCILELNPCHQAHILRPRP
jgi:hypothetical protein